MEQALTFNGQGILLHREYKDKKTGDMKACYDLAYLGGKVGLSFAHNIDIPQHGVSVTVSGTIEPGKTGFYLRVQSVM